MRRKMFRTEVMRGGGEETFYAQFFSESFGFRHNKNDSYAVSSEPLGRFCRHPSAPSRLFCAVYKRAPELAFTDRKSRGKARTCYLGSLRLASRVEAVLETEVTSTFCISSHSGAPSSVNSPLYHVLEFHSTRRAA
jgi:hypothetical protein